jgi:hypothetical protein
MEQIDPEAPEQEPRPVAYPLPIVAWIHDGPVCVTIVDTPPVPPRHGICQCEACAHARFADLPPVDP